jgi:hypothetical protein
VRRHCARVGFRIRKVSVSAVSAIGYEPLPLDRSESRAKARVDAAVVLGGRTRWRNVAGLVLRGDQTGCPLTHAAVRGRQQRRPGANKMMVLSTALADRSSASPARSLVGAPPPLVNAAEATSLFQPALRGIQARRQRLDGGGACSSKSVVVANRRCNRKADVVSNLANRSLTASRTGAVGTGLAPLEAHGPLSRFLRSGHGSRNSTELSWRERSGSYKQGRNTT